MLLLLFLFFYAGRSGLVRFLALRFVLSVGFGKVTRLFTHYKVMRSYMGHGACIESSVVLRTWNTLLCTSSSICKNYGVKLYCTCSTDLLLQNGLFLFGRCIRNLGIVRYTSTVTEYWYPFRLVHSYFVVISIYHVFGKRNPFYILQRLRHSIRMMLLQFVSTQIVNNISPMQHQRDQVRYGYLTLE